ncbi:tannase/feruloyl esterase family alpha/beta hydrolase [Cereibacter sphaeroides]|uniref:tannase/feruloyl esterase family alpha/beta hydrolase n=1 Tax=Cereibacter sphaeroides TaxID=1063 RepID=UPI0002F4B51D|nr:tannase/feruloyl esterase family alpha/beta hydrolase [Cereibacter sphaeroides]
MTFKILALSASAVAGIAHGGFAATLTADKCEAMNGRHIAKTEFSLETGGALVESAEWTGGKGPGGFCKLGGAIRPVDPGAPPIKWQVNLPKAWNGRLLQYGGSGYSGVLPETLEPIVQGPKNGPTPLAQGYVTFGSDSGHTAQNTNDASFAANNEALQNYAYMHIKKTLDVARTLVTAVYGEEPQAVYYAGGSTGGREALTAALRWPESYDGVISYYPTANFVGLRLWGAALNRRIYDNESAGWIAPELVAEIAAYATKICDGLDGAEDGLVSNVKACRARSSDLIDHFACDGGGVSSSCLTKAQIDGTISLYHDGYELPYSLANGFNRYSGYNSLEGILMNLGTQPDYAEPVVSGPNAHHAARAYEFFRYFISGEAPFDYRSFDIKDPGPYRERLLEIASMVDANDPDLSKFKASGGKVILVQGTEDPSVTPHGTAALYQNMIDTLGEENVTEFVRFYMLPGLAHGRGNMAPTWDSLAALDNWATNGVQPVGYVVTDSTDSPSHGRTMPLCEYPSWPKFTGAGDMREASNFACALE